MKDNCFNSYKGTIVIITQFENLVSVDLASIPIKEQLLYGVEGF